MFAFSSPRPAVPAALRERIRPVADAGARRLVLGEPWDELLPKGGLVRGTTVVVHAAPGAGGLTLALHLVGAASAAGHWGAVVGVDDPGVIAMQEMGVDLRRVIFVPRPRGAWAEATADLLDGVEVVVVRPPGRVALGAARRLMARSRERGGVVVALSEPSSPWPLPADVTIEIVEATWSTTSRLEGRRALVRVSGRGAARRPVERWLSLPDPTGRVLAS